MSTYIDSLVFYLLALRYIPQVKYVPAWLPGAQFKRDAKEWSRKAEAIRCTPFEFAKDLIVSLSFIQI